MHMPQAPHLGEHKGHRSLLVHELAHAIEEGPAARLAAPAEGFERAEGDGALLGALLPHLQLLAQQPAYPRQEGLPHLVRGEGDAGYAACRGPKKAAK